MWIWQWWKALDWESWGLKPTIYLQHRLRLVSDNEDWERVNPCTAGIRFLPGANQQQPGLIPWVMVLNRTGCSLFSKYFTKKFLFLCSQWQKSHWFHGSRDFNLVFIFCHPEISLKDSPDRKENTPCASLQSLPWFVSFFWGCPQREEFHWLGKLRDTCGC